MIKFIKTKFCDDKNIFEIKSVFVIAFFAVINFSETAHSSNVSNKNSIIKQCWSGTTKQNVDITYCFKDKSSYYAVALGRIDGWDFVGKWHLKGDNIIQVDNHRCKYTLSADRRVLFLKNCRIEADYKLEENEKSIKNQNN